MRLAVKVVPGSSRNCIAGWLGESLKIRVQAPPEGGKANKAVIKLLAEATSVKSESISVVHGRSSPRKIIEICGLSDAQLRQRLAGKFC